MASGVTLSSSPTTLTGSYSYVYGPATGTYTVTNLGAIAATATTFPGAVYLKLGGSFTNGSGTATAASVTGFGTSAGVDIVGAPGVVTNFGTINGGAASRGVELYGGGTVINGSPGDTLAAIGGNGIEDAVFVSGTPASTIVNYGTLGSPASRNGVAVGSGAGFATVINGSTADAAAVMIGGTGTSGVGVYMGGANGGTIENFATIGGADGRAGINLGTASGPTGITNGSTADETALITAGDTNGSAIYSQDSSGQVSIVNYGILQATAGSVINLLHGGTVTNGSAGDTTAVIQQHGTHTGVYAKYGSTTVVNFGTIGDASGHSGIGFGTAAGIASIINGSTADTVALITGGTSGGNGVAGNSNTSPVDVLNYGTIAGTAGAAIVMNDGGSVQNGGGPDTSALIAGNGTHSAIYIHGGTATVTNYGTVGSATGANAIAFQSPAGFGTIVNGSTADLTALIMGGATAGNGINTGGPTDRLDVVNFATITASGAAAVELSDGGTVTNGSAGDTSALIQAPGTHSGVYVENGVNATVVNFATIGGSFSGNAVSFGTAAPFGAVINGSTADTTALLTAGATGATAVAMENPNNPLSVANYGTISSFLGNGVYLEGGGTVTNGSTGDTAAAISGSTIHSAISAKRLVTVSNFGTISDPGPLHTVYATDGAQITNGSGSDTTALMAAIGSGVEVKGAALTLTNFATIANTASVSNAVYTDGGTITNGSPADAAAVIETEGDGGNGIGVYGAIAGPVTNYGTIAGGTGILFGTGSGAGTVINAGTIEGNAGDAILFQDPGGLVVADPGAVFDGLVDASASSDTVLQLAAGAGPGTLDGIGSNFLGFSATTVDTAADWVLTGANSLAGGTTLSILGTLTDTTSLDGTGAVVLSGGTALLANGLSSFVSISMAGSTANTVAVPGSSDGTLANAIAGFGVGDRIEVANVSFDGATQDGSTLELTSGGTTVFTLGSVAYESMSAPHFEFGTDSTTGFDFVEIACFAAGTRIMTAAGEVAVEDLRAGMLVPSLAQAGLLRVEWIGHRAVNAASHRRGQDVWPVRIAAHAFGPGRPHRDLVLSPDHAVAVPGAGGGTVLIPARHLVNGAGIVQERRDSVGYYHVELRRHGVVVAEGLETESYLDTGNRLAFGDAGGAVRVARQVAAE